MWNRYILLPGTNNPYLDNKPHPDVSVTSEGVPSVNKTLPGAVVSSESFTTRNIREWANG